MSDGFFDIRFSGESKIEMSINANDTSLIDFDIYYEGDEMQFQMHMISAKVLVKKINHLIKVYEHYEKADNTNKE